MQACLIDSKKCFRAAAEFRYPTCLFSMGLANLLREINCFCRICFKDGSFCGQLPCRVFIIQALQRVGLLHNQALPHKKKKRRRKRKRNGGRWRRERLLKESLKYRYLMQSGQNCSTDISFIRVLCDLHNLFATWQCVSVTATLNMRMRLKVTSCLHLKKFYFHKTIKLIIFKYTVMEIMA